MYGMIETALEDWFKAIDEFLTKEQLNKHGKTTKVKTKADRKKRKTKRQKS
jgi:hypothetical protein